MFVAFNGKLELLPIVVSVGIWFSCALIWFIAERLMWPCTKMDKRRRTRKTRAATTLRSDPPRRQAINRDNPRRNAMGTVKVTIGVGDPQGRQFEELDVTVDTGSTYTAVPRAMLQRLGVPVERSLPSETADGRIVPVDVGEATIRLQGRQFHTPVIFAEENEPSLLGVVSLEQAALAVDPLAGRLIPTNLLRL